MYYYFSIWKWQTHTGTGTSTGTDTDTEGTHSLTHQNRISFTQFHVVWMCLSVWFFFLRLFRIQGQQQQTKSGKLETNKYLWCDCFLLDSLGPVRCAYFVFFSHKILNGRWGYVSANFTFFCSCLPIMRTGRRLNTAQSTLTMYVYT